VQWNIRRSIDLYDIDVIANYETQEILWNVTTSIVLTLKSYCEILETRFIFNLSPWPKIVKVSELVEARPE
jgi:hypothetical protein